MCDIRSAIKNTVSISMFNRGLAGKIFEEVKSSGAKVVMKNNSPECVLLSPDEYIAIIDELEDNKLLKLAEERSKNLDLNKTIPANEFYKNLGIKQEDIDKAPDVEIE